MLEFITLSKPLVDALRAAVKREFDTLIEERDSLPPGEGKSDARKEAKVLEELFRFIDRTDGKMLIASTGKD